MAHRKSGFRRGRTYLFTSTLAALTTLGTPVASRANNYGESLAWQFKTSTDRANQAAVLDLIQKRRDGYYAAPIYNTTIARQVNCSISATATGNSGGQSAVANSPNVTGATSTATGNGNTTAVDPGRAGTTTNAQQSNGAAVTAGVTGATETSVQGVAWQALNSNQSNGGNQSANVQGSNACAFATLN
ncbi:MAG: hypothetical protein JWR80_4228 [Bradyrhizobium sp.]|nr:hypothetical protein [Bradyrhizobium sp.]